MSLAAPVAAGPFEDATAALERHDYATAVQLFRPLAEQGNAEAQHNLGYLYQMGFGVPRDYVYAYMWLNLAVAQGDQFAQFNRTWVEKHMSPAQLAEAQKLSREWKPTKQPSR